MQIHCNGTNFINPWLTQRVFSAWPVAQPVVGEMEMHSVANLATLQTPLATFFSFKKASKPYLVSENRPVLLPEHEVLLSQGAHTHLSLSLLALCVCSVSVQRVAAGREEQRFNLVKHRYYFACFSNYTWRSNSRNHRTAIVIILCVFDFIKRRLDYHDFCAD